VAAEGTAWFLSRTHDVVAVDGRTGVVRWKATTGEPGESTNGSRLLLAGSLVIAGDYDIVAFDRMSGERRWHFAPPDGYGAGIYLGTAAGDAIYAGSPSGTLFAVATSGSLRWRATLANGDHTTVFEPIVTGRHVVTAFVSFGDHPTGGLGAFDRETGALEWRAAWPHARDAAGSLPTGSLIAAGQLVMATTRDGAIHAFDRDTGVERWSAPGLKDARVGWPDAPNDFRALAATSKLVVAGSLSGLVAAYDAATGRERWRRRPSAASVALEIAADENRVYVPYMSGDLHVLDTTDGMELWHLGDADGAFRWRPAIAGGRYFATSTSGFFAFVR
jgi:outer membrane protein assembly factor BamB